MTKYRAVLTAGFALLCTLPLWGISDQELLKQVDGLASYTDADFSAEYEIIQYKPGQSSAKTLAQVYRRDSRETYVIVILQPVISRGQGYLKQEKTLWFYDPKSKRFNSTSSQERFQNTNARNSDFTRSTLAEDYRVVSGVSETLGRFRCRVLTLEALTNEVSYPKMKIWISEDGLLRKSEDYSLSGQLLRTSAVDGYWQVGKRYIPKKIIFVDALRGAPLNGKFINERTEISVNKPSFKKLDNATFSKTYLETISR